jgi:phosphoglycerol transferase
MKNFRKKHKSRHIVLILALFVLDLLTFSFVWCTQNFGNIGLNEIVFTMNMPLEGTSTDYFYSYFRGAFCPAVIVLVLEILIFAMPVSKKFVVHIGIRERKFCVTVFPVRLKNYMWGTLCIVWLAILIFNADKKF